MGYYALLKSLGEKIFNRIIEDTNPDDEFLLSIIDTETFKRLQDETTRNRQEMDKALKYTGELFSVPSDKYVAITIATLQVYLIYGIDYETKINTNSFYEILADFYPNLSSDIIILKYFDSVQEPLWEKVKDAFAEEKRHLLLPPKKKGAGKYVQFPKSQRIIRWHELIGYADKFCSIDLEPYQILSLNEFCDRVTIDYRHEFSSEENRAIKRIVFSFYNKWDGSTTDEIKKQRFIPTDTRHDMQVLKDSSPRITLEMECEKIIFLSDGKKISENELMNMFPEKYILPFVSDEYYGDWIYVTRRRILQAKDKLLILTKKSHRLYLDNFMKYEESDLKMKYFRIFIFETCNQKTADFAKLKFDKNEIFTIIGGIRSRSNYNSENTILGHWYDFALPKIKIDLPHLKSVYISSKEISVDENQIDLSKLLRKDGKLRVIPREKVYSLKCADISPVYFFVEKSKPHSNAPINSGWILSPTDLRPVNQNENPDIAGLKILKMKETAENNYLRPFLFQAKRLQNRIGNNLDDKIKSIETRKCYGC